MTWGLFYSVVAYKDLGTAVRFKLQILPIMLGLIVFLLRRPVGRQAHARQHDAGLNLAKPSAA
jgi:hypothetical protein